MSIEIERKFLVKNNDFIEQSFQKKKIVQGFLNRDKNCVVRVRILDDSGWLTIKGISSNDGTSRFEWEKTIAIEDAEQLLKLCEKYIIDKDRYLVKTSSNHIFEVDVFKGDNEGLIVAEVELNTVNEDFEKPKWLGNEVTGVKKYYNSEISKTPYKKW